MDNGIFSFNMDEIPAAKRGNAGRKSEIITTLSNLTVGQGIAFDIENEGKENETFSSFAKRMSQRAYNPALRNKETRFLVRADEENGLVRLFKIANETQEAISE